MPASRVARHQFHELIEAASDPLSRGEEKIIKPEFQEALDVLPARMTKRDRDFVAHEMDGRELSRSVGRQLREIVGGSAGAGTKKLTEATKQAIRERAEEVMANGELESYPRSHGLSKSTHWESFVVSDSTCPPGVMCLRPSIWAGEIVTAHVPAGRTKHPSDPNKAEVFYLEKGGPVATVQTFYGPIEIRPKLEHHTPQVTDVDYFPGVEGSGTLIAVCRKRRAAVKD